MEHLMDYGGEPETASNASDTEEKEDESDVILAVLEAGEALSELEKSCLKNLRNRMWEELDVEESLSLMIKFFDDHGNYLGMPKGYLKILKMKDLSDETIFSEAFNGCISDLVAYDGNPSVLHRRLNMHMLACFFQLQFVAPNSTLVPALIAHSFNYLVDYGHDWTELTSVEKDFMLNYLLKGDFMTQDVMKKLLANIVKNL